MCVCMCVYMYMYVCVYVCVYMYMCVCVYISAHIHTRWPPWWLSGKESSCQCRSCRFYLWLRKISQTRKWQPLQYSCPGNPMNREAWKAIVHGVTEKDRHDLVTKTAAAYIYMCVCVCVCMCIVYVYTTSSLSICLLRDIWIASIFWLLQIVLLFALSCLYLFRFSRCIPQSRMA